MPVIIFSQEAQEAMMSQFTATYWQSSYQLRFQLHDGPIQRSLGGWDESVLWQISLPNRDDLRFGIESTNPPRWFIDWNEFDTYATAQKTGTATWFSLSQRAGSGSSESRYAIVGTVSSIGGGGDYEMENPAIVDNQDYKMLGKLTVAQPKTYTYT